MNDLDQPLDLQESSDLPLNAEMLGYLLSSAKWGTFMAIMGFIFTGFMVIGALAFMLMGSNDLFPGVGQGMLGVVYLILAAIYFFPTLFLYRFSAQTKAAIRSGAESTMTDGLRNLQLLFKFTGILTIVMISIYAVMIIIGLVAGISSTL